MRFKLSLKSMLSKWVACQVVFLPTVFLCAKIALLADSSIRYLLSFISLSCFIWILVDSNSDKRITQITFFILNTRMFQANLFYSFCLEHLVSQKKFIFFFLFSASLSFFLCLYWLNNLTNEFFLGIISIFVSLCLLWWKIRFSFLADFTADGSWVAILEHLRLKIGSRIFPDKTASEMQLFLPVVTSKLSLKKNKAHFPSFIQKRTMFPQMKDAMEAAQAIDKVVKGSKDIPASAKVVGIGAAAVVLGGVIVNEYQKNKDKADDKVYQQDTLELEKRKVSLEERKHADDNFFKKEDLVIKKKHLEIEGMNAETQRMNAETQRMGAEIQRVDAETQRVDAETQRVDAETRRIAVAIYEKQVEDRSGTTWKRFIGSNQSTPPKSTIDVYMEKRAEIASTSVDPTDVL